MQRTFLSTELKSILKNLKVFQEGTLNFVKTGQNPSLENLDFDNLFQSTPSERIFLIQEEKKNTVSSDEKYLIHKRTQEVSPLSLVLESSQLESTILRELQIELFQLTSAVLNTNAYYSGAQSKSFGIHSDDSFVLIYQLRGQKQWTVATEDRVPTGISNSYQFQQSQFEHFVLKEGEWLLINAYVPHLARNYFDQSSIHLTISLGFPRLEDVMASYLNTMKFSEKRLLMSSEDIFQFASKAIFSKNSSQLKEFIERFEGNWQKHAVGSTHAKK